MSTAEETPHEAPQEQKKECDWCRELIRIDAVKCPHCHKWRKDITEDRKKHIGYCVVSMVMCLLAILLFAKVWEDSSSGELRFGEHLAKAGEWHERVGKEFNGNDYYTKMLTTPVDKLKPGDYVGNAHYEFSMRKFLSSVWGWAVIGLAIGGVWLGTLARRMRNDLERKWGSRWQL